MRFDQFSTVAFAKTEFGMETSVRGNVLIRVERKPMNSTTPSTPAAVIQSPTMKGLSTISETEPKKFAIVSFEANANAAPPIPRDATTAVMFAPSVSRITRNEIV